MKAKKSGESRARHTPDREAAETQLPSPFAWPGNQSAVTHGGEAAIKRLHDGGDFVGLAKAAEDAVIQELAREGPRAIINRNARRLQAASDLYWTAIEHAATDRDLERLDKYVARFGWLASKALVAWTQVAEQERDTPSVTAGEILESVKHERDDKPD